MVLVRDKLLVAGRPDLNQADARLDVTSGQMPITNDQSPTGLVALIGMLTEILGDFIFDGSGQHLLSPLSQDFGQSVLRTY